MTDSEVAIQIRASLKKVFPDTVFQVTVIDGHLDIDTVGGKRKYEQYTDEQFCDLMVKAVLEIVPTYQLWFDVD